MLQQELTDKDHIIGKFEADKAHKHTQTAMQAESDALPQRPTASHVVRRTDKLGVTGLAIEVAPEGLYPTSVATEALQAGLGQRVRLPAVRVVLCQSGVKLS